MVLSHTEFQYMRKRLVKRLVCGKISFETSLLSFENRYNCENFVGRSLFDSSEHLVYVYGINMCGLVYSFSDMNNLLYM